MSIRWGYAMLMLGALQVRSQTLPLDVHAPAPPNLATLTAAAQLNLSAGEALLQSGNYFYTVTTGVAFARPAALSVNPLSVQNLSLGASSLASVQGVNPADPWPGATLRVSAASPTTPLRLATASLGLAPAPGSPTSFRSRYQPPVNADGTDLGIPLTISNMDVVFIPTTAPVPEPSVYGLAGLGLALWGWQRRRRAKTAQ